MDGIDGGAPAPAESTPAPAPEAVQLPNPISTEPQKAPEPKAEAKPEPKADKPVESKPISTREALQKAREKVEADNKPAEAKTEAKTEAKPADKPAPVKSEPARDETGKFAAKEPATPEAKPEPKASFTASEPPARFSADAKARWAETHESIRGETERAIRELTEGHQKYKAAAERDAGLAEFHEMAQQSGKELRNVVREYVNMENALRQDLVGGLNEICSRMGVSLRDVAAHVMGQPADQASSAQDATIRELKNKIAQLEQGVGQVTQTFQQQREQATLQEVTAFAEKNPRFEELADDIAFFMKSGRAKDLSEAYQLAERLNPAPKAPEANTAASSAPVIDLTAQTERGQKSIAGSPTPGSDPVRRQPSTSIKESLRRAMAQAG